MYLGISISVLVYQHTIGISSLVYLAFGKGFEGLDGTCLSGDNTVNLRQIKDKRRQNRHAQDANSKTRAERMKERNGRRKRKKESKQKGQRDRNRDNRRDKEIRDNTDPQVDSVWGVNSAKHCPPIMPSVRV